MNTEVRFPANSDAPHPRRSTLAKLLVSLAVAVAMIATIIPAASADPGDDEDGKIILPHELEQDDTPPPPPGPGADTPLAQRRYKVTVDKFWVQNESGWDLAGSDEVVWHFTAENDRGAIDFTTGEYGNVDDGDTVEMGGICITPGGCNDGGGGNLLLTATAVEIDGPLSALATPLAGLSNLSHLLYSQFGPADWVNPMPRFQQETGLYLASLLSNDVIGSDVIALSEERLATQVPYIGSTRTRIFDAKGWGGDYPLAGDAHYKLYVDITRLADAESTVASTTAAGTAGTVGTVSTSSQSANGVSLEPEEEELQMVVQNPRSGLSTTGLIRSGGRR